MTKATSEDFYHDKDLIGLFEKLSKTEFLEKNPHITELEYNKTRAKWHNKEDMRTTNKQLRQAGFPTDDPMVNDMRYDLAEREAMNMNVGDIIELLMNGFQGLDNMPEIDVREEWESVFGETEDGRSN